MCSETGSCSLKHPPAPEWVRFTLDLLTQCCVNEQGLLVSVLDADGHILDDEPPIADFGDILPFLFYWGYEDFALDQVRRATPHLWRGLYAPHGRIRAFNNHDWLLGLLDLYRLANAAWLLDLACEAAQSLWSRLSFRGFILNEPPDLCSWRSWLRRADAFNGGYIELLTELAYLAHTSEYLDFAEETASAWLRTPLFREKGLFGRFENPLYGRLCAPPICLFKDNTNLVHGLIALFGATGSEIVKAGIEKWLDAFEAHFWNGGNVNLFLDRSGRAIQPDLKAAFSSLDLLFECHEVGIRIEQVERLAFAVIEYWLALQWPNGLFPCTPGSDRDHLDANTDMAIALTQWGSITSHGHYRLAAASCIEAILSTHRMLHGFALSVDPQGDVRDDRIVVKYQGLLLKLSLLDGAANPLEIDLLRDR